MSAGFMSEVRLRRYFGPLACQMPEKSGLPSARRGAGALRFGFPSAPMGMLEGILVHWARAGMEPISKRAGSARKGFIAVRLYLNEGSRAPADLQSQCKNGSSGKAI